MANFARTRLTISNRLTLLILSAVVGVALVTGLFLHSEKNLILEERQSTVQQAVMTAAGIVDFYREQAAKGVLDTAAAQKQALAALRSLRYGKGEYFWVNDQQPKMLMHPIKPALDQSDLTGNVDPDGKHLFVEMKDVVKRDGQGFVFYRWPKPGSDTPVRKVSYVQGISEWNWIIGSGVYIDTIDATMTARASYFGIAGVVLSALLFLIGRSIASSITRPLTQAVIAAKRIASGNLTGQISAASNDEVGQLLSALAIMNSNLAGIVGRVRVGTEAIATASAQIAAGNLDLSSRTEEQASTLEQTAASMEELTATVQQNAEYASRAHEMAVSASTIAQNGGQTVTEVIDSMDAIRGSSGRIVEIIAVIEGIAFQTNILALNAAVEAARAGEQGRGFAVVASEVRNLAQRAAAASKEIATLIQASVQQVGAGVISVQRAGKTMQDIVVETSGVVAMMEQISNATREQTTGLVQVNVAISAMDQVTQQNASLVEEAASAAISLSEQANDLTVAVGAFTLLEAEKVRSRDSARNVVSSKTRQLSYS